MEKDLHSMTGTIVVNKPGGLTSRDVVNRVSKVLHTKKIGHTGTLDPLATGVLVLVIGKCTKLVEFLTSKYKEYEAEFILGYETDTLDVTGITTKTSDLVVSKSEIEKCIMSFEGTYEQEVPAYSAVKIDGKKLYEYAREGVSINLPKRTVDISSIEVLSVEGTRIRIRTTVSKGTYIRSLIRDIGVNLKTYATMSKLTRTKQGNIVIEESSTLEDIENGNYRIISPLELLSDIETFELNDETYKKVTNGVAMTIESDSKFIKFTYDDELIALYRKEEGIYKMYVKFE